LVYEYVEMPIRAIMSNDFFMGRLFKVNGETLS